MSAWGRYRFLVFVYGLALLIGLWEVFRRADSGPDDGHPKEADVMLELFPDSADVQYIHGVHEVINGNLHKARQHFENALATGVKTDENLLYYYAVTLIQLGADPAEIEQAVEHWRFNYPGSALPDPREALKHSSRAAPAEQLSSRPEHP